MKNPNFLFVILLTLKANMLLYSQMPCICDKTDTKIISQSNILNFQINEIDSVYSMPLDFNDPCSYYRNSLYEMILFLYQANGLYVKTIGTIPKKFIEMKIRSSDSSLVNHNIFEAPVVEFLNWHYDLDIKWEDDSAELFVVKKVDDAKLIEYDFKLHGDYSNLIVGHNDSITESGIVWHNKMNMSLDNSIWSLCTDLSGHLGNEVILDESVIDTKTYNFHITAYDMFGKIPLSTIKKRLESYGLTIEKTKRLRSYLVIKHIENKREKGFRFLNSPKRKNPNIEFIKDKN